MTQLRAKNNINYNDKLIWLIGYPFIALSFIFMANGNSLSELIRLPSFYSDLILAFTLCSVAIFYIRKITDRLDQQLPWAEKFEKRILNQFLLGVLVPLFLTISIEVVYLIIIGVSPIESSIINLELPLAFIMLLLVNCFYMINYFLRKQAFSILEHKTLESKSNSIVNVVVQKGYREEKITLNDCALFQMSNKILWLHTHSGEQFRIIGTLEEWEAKLPKNEFYRLNRQFIACRKVVQSIEQTETRKLRINISLPKIQEEIFVSKPNAADFRIWWKSESPL
jgi:LytTr DNA-binding domain